MKPEWLAVAALVALVALLALAVDREAAHKQKAADAAFCYRAGFTAPLYRGLCRD